MGVFVHDRVPGYTEKVPRRTRTSTFLSEIPQTGCLHELCSRRLCALCDPVVLHTYIKGNYLASCYCGRGKRCIVS